MPRRPHRKSRSGCFGCKRRHIKVRDLKEALSHRPVQWTDASCYWQCDEGRPRCVNCHTAGLDCAYATGASISAPTTPAIESETNSTSTSGVVTPEQHRQGHDRFHVPTLVPSEAGELGLNMEHLELLHQFITNTYTTFSDLEDVQTVWRTSIPRLAFLHPYLMYELLAISALHLAYCRPENASRYYTKSTELQSQALNNFNSVQRAVTASTCAPTLIFTSLLAVHVLADPSRTVALDSSQYLDHVIHCLMLMRNVQKLVITDWIGYLRDSELKPIFEFGSDESHQIPQPCLDLSKLTENSDLGDQAKEAYDEAIERLHWVYTKCIHHQGSYTTVRWLLAWPIQLKEAYQDRLSERRPEALVILAYFAVVLQYYKNCWVVGDSGQFLIRAIHSHLGPHWAKWMEWPLSFVATPSGAG